MGRPPISALALFLAGCLALTTAGVYVAFIAANGTDIGHWRYLKMAVVDAILVGTPSVLIAAAIFAWTSAYRAGRGAALSRRTYGLTALSAVFALVMLLGQPHSEAVPLLAEQVLRLTARPA